MFLAMAHGMRVVHSCCVKPSHTSKTCGLNPATFRSISQWSCQFTDYIPLNPKVISAAAYDEPLISSSNCVHNVSPESPHPKAECSSLTSGDAACARMPAHEGKQFLAQNLSHYWVNLLSSNEGPKQLTSPNGFCVCSLKRELSPFRRTCQ